MKKSLWDDDFLRAFASDLQKEHFDCHFWEFGDDDTVIPLSNKHYRIMILKFFPRLGIWNLNLGDGTDGLPIKHLVFVRDGRCQQIDAETLRSITNKILTYMGDLGDQIKSAMVKVGDKSGNLFTKNALAQLPEMYHKKIFADTETTAHRFFLNGWIKITADGVSDLLSYQDLPDDHVVWHSSVIDRPYVTSNLREDLERKLMLLTAESIHPETNKRIDWEVERKQQFTKLKQQLDAVSDVPSEHHFKNFVQNLARKGSDNEIDQQTLEDLYLAIGYLCHRYTKDSNRRMVCIIDTFLDGHIAGSSNGGTGKSLLVKCLGALMNRTEVNGKKFQKGKDHSKVFGNVTPATEIVHIDDAHRRFHLEEIYAHITGDFEVDKKYGRCFSIPAAVAPKVVVTSNHPIGTSDPSDERRIFNVEVGGYYLSLKEERNETPFHHHGYKDFLTDWSDRDWGDFYEFVFSCISFYLSRGELPAGCGSESLKRQKILRLLGSEDLLDYFVQLLNQQVDSGGELFVATFLLELRAQFPEDTQGKSDDTLKEWIKRVGRFLNVNVNHSRQRLTSERWDKWVAEGHEKRPQRNAILMKQGERVPVMTFSSLKKPSTLFSKPDFSVRKTSSPVVGVATATSLTELMDDA